MNDDMILESPLGKHVCFTNGHASYDYVILDFINNLDLESTKDHINLFLKCRRNKTANKTTTSTWWDVGLTKHLANMYAHRTNLKTSKSHFLSKIIKKKTK